MCSTMSSRRHIAYFGSCGKHGIFSFPAACLQPGERPVYAAYVYSQRRPLRLLKWNYLLGVASIVLILLFGGQTEHLIPLYAVGVFIPFTLSQTGMCIKWIKQNQKAGSENADQLLRRFDFVYGSVDPVRDEV